MVEGGGGPDHRGTSPRSRDKIHLSMAPKCGQLRQRLRTAHYYESGNPNSKWHQY